MSSDSSYIRGFIKLADLPDAKSTKSERKIYQLLKV